MERCTRTAAIGASLPYNISQSRYNRASRVEGGTEYIMSYCHKKDGIEFYICTCPSWTARSTAGMDLAACPSLERAPLMEDLSKEKQRWQRSQPMTLLYSWFVLQEIRDASLL